MAQAQLVGFNTAGTAILYSPGSGGRHGAGQQPNDSNKSYSDGLTVLCGNKAVISSSNLKSRRFVASLDGEFGNKSSS